jgi:hypothetical protein
MHQEHHSPRRAEYVVMTDQILNRVGSVGPLLGLPRPPRGISEFRSPASPLPPEFDLRLKQSFVSKIIDHIMERGKMEIWAEIKRRIENDGIDILGDLYRQRSPWIFSGSTSDEIAITNGIDGAEIGEFQQGIDPSDSEDEIGEVLGGLI